MTALDRLRAIDKSYRSEDESEHISGMISLGELKYLLLPAFEALEKLTMLDMEGDESMLRAVSVLAELEEALKDA